MLIPGHIQMWQMTYFCSVMAINSRDSETAQECQMWSQVSTCRWISQWRIKVFYLETSWSYHMIAEREKSAYYTSKVKWFTAQHIHHLPFRAVFQEVWQWSSLAVWEQKPPLVNRESGSVTSATEQKAEKLGGGRGCCDFKKCLSVL